MRRRRFVSALLTGPAASILVAQQGAPGVPANPAPGIPLNPTQPVQPPPRASDEFPKLDVDIADGVADPAPRLFNAQQFAALEKLSEVLMPPVKGTPGAADAKAAEFLDFLIANSPEDRRRLYVNGLDALNAGSRKRFHQEFAALNSAETAEMLAPLRQPWADRESGGAVEDFLQAAKQDVREATVNSREYVTKSASGGRRGGGTAQYWYPVD